MSIMQKIFGVAQAPAQQPAAPTVPTNNMSQGNPIPVTAPQGTVPDPLSKYEKLWEPTPIESDTSTPITAQSIMEAARKVDFSKGLNPEDLMKIQSGGPEAVQALSAILNQTAQQAYGQSAYASQKLIEQAVAQAREQFTAQIPQLVNQQTSRELINKETKAFENPAVAPLVQMIHTNLLQKYPNASSAEIATMAKEMMQGAANVFSPQAPAKADSGPKADNWEGYF